MTLPDERTNAVQNVEIFLLALCDPKKTPRVPSEIRKRARSLLRHYPTSYDLFNASRKIPETFSSPRDTFSEIWGFERDEWTIK